MEKVSVIVPMYNAEKSIERCLKSLINQTILKKYPNTLEVIIVNDASTDNGRKVVEQYKNMHPSVIRVVDKTKNEGTSVARNTGIKFARGKYIGFVDADDYVALNMYEDYVCAMEKYNVNMVSGGFLKTPKLIKNGMFESNPLYPDEIIIYDRLQDKYKEIGSRSQSVWNRLYKKEVLENHQFLPGKTDEDAGVFYPLITERGKTVLLPHTYYIYTDRNDNFNSVSNILNNKITDKLLDVFDVSLDAFNYCESQNYDREQMYYNYNLFGKTAYWNLRNMLAWKVEGKQKLLKHKIYMEAFKIYLSLYDFDYIDDELRYSLFYIAPPIIPNFELTKEEIGPKLELLRKDIQKLM